MDNTYISAKYFQSIPLRFCELWILVLFGTTCYASRVDGISKDGLLFVPFEPFVPCGDGSPAGIYQEISPASVSGENHVLVFLGGNMCTTDEKCRKKLETEPYKLSSEFWPKSLEGYTILSRNAAENPITSDFTRWVVPYCSQDIFLGSGNSSTEVARAGDVSFEAALDYWKDSIKFQPIDTLIVVGISAGAFGLMNHVESVQQVSRAAHVGKLRLILESVAVPSRNQNVSDIQEALQEFVDFEKHPLCNLPYTQKFQTTELWSIPCCTSIHCMLENDPVLSNWAQTNDNNGNERLLLLDSIYDPIEFLSVATVSGIDSKPTLSSLDAYTSEVFEAGGARKQQFLQSTYGSASRLGNRVLWAVTNVLAHSFLLPALEIEQLRCNVGKGKNALISVCRENGLGVRGEILYGLQATAWWTTDSWQLITVNNIPIQSIIYDFVNQNPKNMSHGLIQDTCNGPNCLPLDATEPNPAGDLFVVDNDFVSISPGFQAFLSSVMACLGLAYILRLLPVKVKDLKEQSEESKARENKTIHIRNVSVEVKGQDKKLLDNLSFNIIPGRICGLFGSSGSGKSTLFNLLCGKLPSDLYGFERNSDFKLLGLQASYLRQFDYSSLQNIELSSFLTTTARLYGASESELVEVIRFLRKSFGDRIGEGPDFGGIKINQLSGGQQRTVAIIATLLTRPQLLLLDEPLSGLDSVSSHVVMQLLQDLAKERSISVIISIHQPSDKIMEQLDDVLILQGGELAVNDSLRDILQRETSSSKFIDDTIGNYVKQPKKRQSLLDSLLSHLGSTISGESRMTSVAESFSSVVKPVEGARESSQAEPGDVDDACKNGNKDEDSVCTADIERVNPSLRRRSSVHISGSIVAVNDGETRRYSLIDNNTRQIPLEDWKPTIFDYWQIKPMMRRMHLEYGSDISNLFVLPTCFAFISLLLRYDKGSPIQLLFVGVLFCTLPIIIFEPMLHRACMNFQAHQLELEDGRISPTSYFLASLLFLVSVPIISLAIALVIGFVILGWDFGSYIDQYLFAAIYLLISFQIGRVLIVISNGEYRIVNNLYVLYQALSFTLSGALMSPNKLPPGLRWLTYISLGFWSIAGISIVQFERSDFGGDDNPCSSLQSCVIQNGAFLARTFGYTPIATTRSAYLVLLLVLLFFFALEYALLWKRYK